MTLHKTLSLNTYKPNGEMLAEGILISLAIEDGYPTYVGIEIRIHGKSFVFRQQDLSYLKETTHLSNLYLILSTMRDMFSEKVVHSARYFDADWFSLVVSPFSTIKQSDRCVVDIFVDSYYRLVGKNDAEPQAYLISEEMPTYLKFRFLCRFAEVLAFAKELDHEISMLKLLVD